MTKRKPEHGGPRPGAGTKKGTKWSPEALERNRARRADAHKSTTGVVPAAAKTPVPEPKPMFDARTMRALAEASNSRLHAQRRRPELSPFQLPRFPPQALPPKKLRMAMDANLNWAGAEWSGSVLNQVGYEGLAFLGYPFLSELAQRPEYRVISETIADDATRKWIDYEITGEKERKKKEQDEDERQRADKARGGLGAVDFDPTNYKPGDLEKGRPAPPGRGFTDPDPADREAKMRASGKMDKVKAIKDELARLDLRDNLYAICRDDGFFGRAHLYLNFGEEVDGGGDGELKTDIGDGRDATSQGKVNKDKPLRSVKPIEPVWMYPLGYNANNPLRDDFYKPQTWYVLGRQLHASRALPFIGHPVPDLLKPAYSFGGISLSQLAMPYVDIWLQTRNSVAALIRAFSVMVLETDMQTILAPGGGGLDGLMARAAAFNLMRDNQGLFVLNKNTEGFQNVSASLSGLHELQGQAQEHMASVVRIPMVKLTGISPAGLNACLTGDTLIETDQGRVPIRDIRPGQKVMTRKGWAPVAKAGCTGYATELIEIETAESTIRCTADHRIWLPSINAFVPAMNVRRGDLLLCRGATANPNMADRSRTEADGGGTRGAAITPRRHPTTGNICFTGRFGAFTTDLFRKAATSTTSTEIAQTINLLISKCLRLQITRSFTALMLDSLLADQANASANAATAAIGLSRKNCRELNFAAIGAGLQIDEKTGCREPSRVLSACASHAEHLSRRNGRTQNFALGNAQSRAKTAPYICPTTTKKTPISGSNKESVEILGVVSSVRRVPAQEFVYDIQVASGHLPEFFANGVLVHNSSEGEMMAYYDTIAAYQNRFLRPHLTRIVNFVQLSLFGEIDAEITFEFEPLREMSEKEVAELQKSKAERDQIFVDGGAISPEEWRKEIIDDPDLPFADLNPEDVPELKQEEEQGLVPQGAGKGLEAVLGDPAKPGGGGAAPGGGAAQDPAFKKPDGGAAAGDAAVIPFSAGDVDPLFAGIAADAFEWLEDDHPRDPKGEFAPKGGGGAIGSGGGKPSKGYGSGSGRFMAPQYGLWAPPGGQPWHEPPKPKPPLDPRALKRVGPQMGSNPGGVFEDAAGRRFYVKEGQSKDHVRNELTAAALYDLAGAPTMRYRPVLGGGHVATELEKLSKDNASKLSAEEVKRAKRDFATHAWLANYDAVGTGDDNLVAIHGEPIAIDLGGALEYRARGKPKGDTFADAVGEIDSMRDPGIAPDASKIFGDITPAEFRDSARRVTGIPDDEVRDVVLELGGSKELAEKLVRRKEDIARRAKTFGAEGDPRKASSVVIFAPGEKPPAKTLNGVAFEAWEPPADGNWNEVGGQADLDEEPLSEHQKHGKQLASGVVIREPDGRVWLMRPKNAFGGYEGTFPKGRVEPGLSLQANAIKEAFEETGLKVKIKSVLADREGDATMTRYYVAEREGGDPADLGEESDGVVLAPTGKLGNFLNRERDREIVTQIGDAAFDWSESKHPRDQGGEFAGIHTPTKREAMERFDRATAHAREEAKHGHHGGGGGLKPLGAAMGYGQEPGIVGDAGWEEGKHPRGQPENRGQFGPGGAGSGEPAQRGSPRRPQQGGSRAVLRQPGPRQGPQRVDQLKALEKMASEILKKATPKQQERHAEHVEKTKKFFSSDPARSSTMAAVKSFAVNHGIGMAQHGLTDAMIFPMVHSVVEAAVSAVGLGAVPGLALGASVVATYAVHHLMEHFHLTLHGAKELVVGVVRGEIDVLGGPKKVAQRISALDRRGMVGDEDEPGDDDVLDSMILLLLAVEDLGEEQAHDEFEESEHPRRDDGKFGHGAGSHKPDEAAAEFETFGSPDDDRGAGLSELTKAVEQGDLSDGLDDDQKGQALGGYSGSTESWDINSALRHGAELPAARRRIVEAMDEAMKKSSLSQNLSVWRALAYKEAMSPEVKQLMDSLQPGDAFVDKGFVSTSAIQHRPSAEVMKILAPKGSKALVVRGTFIGYDGENEVVLDRGGRYEYLGKDAAGARMFRLQQNGQLTGDEANFEALAGDDFDPSEARDPNREIYRP